MRKDCLEIFWKGSNRSEDRKSTRLNSSHQITSYAVFCLKKKKSRRHRAVRCGARAIRWLLLALRHSVRAAPPKCAGHSCAPRCSDLPRAYTPAGPQRTRPTPPAQQRVLASLVRLLPSLAASHLFLPPFVCVSSSLALPLPVNRRSPVLTWHRPLSRYYFFFNDPATPEIYTLSLHDALPI